MEIGKQYQMVQTTLKLRAKNKTTLQLKQNTNANLELHRCLPNWNHKILNLNSELLSVQFKFSTPKLFQVCKYWHVG